MDWCCSGFILAEHSSSGVGGFGDEFFFISNQGWHQRGAGLGIRNCAVLGFIDRDVVDGLTNNFELRTDFQSQLHLSHFNPFTSQGMLVCASLCYGGPMDCVAHQLPNGSVTYVLPKPLCPGEWSFNNTVIAFNEDNGTEYNKTLVSALAEDFITLKSCKHTLTYRKDCAAKPHTIRCSHNCSAMDLTPSGMQGFSSRFHRGCLAALVIPAIVLGILILCASRKVCCFNTTQEKERPSSTC